MIPRAAGRVLKIDSLEAADAARRDIERIVKAWCEWRDAESPGYEADATGKRKAGALNSQSSAVTRRARRKRHADCARYYAKHRPSLLWGERYRMLGWR
jgi:hypothetical protein